MPPNMPACVVLLIALTSAVEGCERVSSTAPNARQAYRADDPGTLALGRHGESSPSASPLARATTREATEAVTPRMRANTSEGSEFADWVIATDPEATVIRDAFVRDNRVLGVIFDDAVTHPEVEKRIESLLSDMRVTFRDQPVEVIAYSQAGDAVARAGLDPAAVGPADAGGSG